jgi:hypothetical protein
VSHELEKPRAEWEEAIRRRLALLRESPVEVTHFDRRMRRLLPPPQAPQPKAGKATEEQH